MRYLAILVLASVLGWLIGVSGGLVVDSATKTCTALAFIQQESKFDPEARSKHSTARGYPQALDGTWRDYQKVGGDHRRRDNLRDAIDFTFWYNDKSRRLLGITGRKDLYLAYHEGWNGYRRGEFSPGIVAIAERVRLTNCWDISKIALSHVWEK